MTATSAVDDFYVHLAMEDARIAQVAGVTFARRLAGANPVDFALALTEQELLVERVIVEAGHSAKQAQLATGHFGTAARDEWERIISGSSLGEPGQA